ncbi:MAG: long-chain fatty acid--CoA ligase [gamma proteobacterium symbiont of Bathyaustriella thionipta]|nr:long-chain fatty acid--CoA ligase [gamma proteobacterium symbiont of Bathyaustriella thionipta]
MSRHANRQTDIIDLQHGRTFAEQFNERVRRSPDKRALSQFNAQSGQWEHKSWRQLSNAVALWRSGMHREGLRHGDRIAIMLKNSVEWVLFDQAAHSLGLVVVPVYTNDRAENIGYILQDAGVKLFLIGDNEQWHALQEIQDQLAGIKRILCLEKPDAMGLEPTIKQLSAWLPDEADDIPLHPADPDDLATIVYTSGTTGRSKGVCLSHTNILYNVTQGLKDLSVYPDDVFLSFLPLSHTLERTVGYYVMVATGASTVYARSIPQLAEDLQTHKPTMLVSVQRIYERVYGKIKDTLQHAPAIRQKLFTLAVEVGWHAFEHRQGRAAWSPRLLLYPLLDKLVGAKIREKMGGRMHMSVCGGAPLSREVAKTFLAMGIPVTQGYGLTETSPIVTANREEDNIPASVGLPLQGIEIRIGDHDELLTRSKSVMLGYWNRPEATAEIIDEDGWLHTGDKARLDQQGHVYITGRLKDILVLSNGEKVPPTDMEGAIELDALFEQALVIGDNKPYLAALIVLNPVAEKELLAETGLNSGNNEALLELITKRIATQLHAFPGYAQIRSVRICDSAWCIENGLLTPTLKLRRQRVIDQYADLVEELYSGH